MCRGKGKQILLLVLVIFISSEVKKPLLTWWFAAVLCALCNRIRSDDQCT